MTLRAGARNSAREAKVAAPPLKTPYNDPFTYFAAVARGSIRSENDPGSLKINMVAMEILDAAIKSAKSGKVVRLRKQPDCGKKIFSTIVSLQHGFPSNLCHPHARPPVVECCNSVNTKTL